jgi:endonuclease/exonuclease/phosphatase family metal-dependent hydrolase
VGLTKSATVSARWTSLRVATFNVRTSRATQDRRGWLKRAPDVAREILSRRPGVVALQELGPGRADGKKGTLHGHMRQTVSLTKTLARLGGGRYHLVRSTPYVKAGIKNGTQGARILYDSSRYYRMNNCPQATGRHQYNKSCAINLPLISGDSQGLRRQAAYAKFRDRRTGKQFFLVSAHLDPRHSGNKKKEAKYSRLRARQATTIANAIARINRSHVPVVFGGDINSWQRKGIGNAPKSALRAKGYRDTATAKNRLNLAYPTVNHFKKTLTKSKSGVGPQLDVLMVKGLRAVTRFENKMKRVDGARPSDHNMVLADIVI